jgi:tetratricopeptide (TPR) repeat protein
VQSKQVRIICALSVVLCAAGPARPQMNNGQEAAVVKGEIENGQPIVGGYTVQLYNLDHHDVLATSDVHPDGEFEFRQTPYGSYWVTVTNGRGDAVYQGNFTVGGVVAEPFIIRLPKEEINRPVSGTISVQQLLHPPARKAFDAMLKAQKFSEAGEFATAAEWLQKAIAISPDYADAWLNLAAQHIRLRAFQQSVDESRHAMELAGPSITALDNLAYASASLGHNEEARESAEQAVRLKPGDAHAHYVMGVILLMTHGRTAEAVRHLQFAAPTIPGAQEALAQVQGKSRQR